MNQILEFLNSHASVRQFTGRDISEEEERTIVTTAQRSPTSSNLQAYSTIAIRDKSKKERLAELAGGQRHVAECRLFVIFCADLHRLKRLCDVRGYAFHGDSTEMFIVATVDTALAAGRALMAAQAMGIGGVMVGGIRNQPDEVAALVSLPEFVYPVMGMSLGYPKSPPRVKPRLPEKGVHFQETYKTEGMDEAVQAYDDTIAAVGYLKGRETEAGEYPGFSGIYSWSEHSARRLASNDPAVSRPHMLGFLRSRGFLKG